MSDSPETSTGGKEDDQRRGFLVKFAAAVIGGVVGVVPAIFAGGFFLTPLLKKKSSDEASDGFMFIGSMDSLVPGGPPRAYKVTGSKKDAWTTYAEAALGSVYIKLGEGGNLLAYNANCPHLGCTVDYKQDKEAFVCPCHDSSFNLNGERSNEIPPRNMDSLEVEVRNDNEIWVKFENFRAGTSAKIPV